jgi:NhaP-type Na+/H+ or K+/H+ antiporter
MSDAPSSVIVQFVSTFGVWLLAERLGLSGVVTIVVFGLTMARRTTNPMPAHLRLPSFAIWESATVVLNVLAFTLIGLQIRPILEALTPDERARYLEASFIILAVVILVRIAWVMTYNGLVRWKNRVFGLHVARSSMAPPTARGGLVVAWSGMRGIVSLAAAMALPAGFPYRDFIQLCAFVVVLGTLLIQGLTLRPLLLLVRLPEDRTVASEIHLARKAALKAAMTALEADESDAAQRLRREYSEALQEARRSGDTRDTVDNALRRQVVDASRDAIQALRHDETIGDDAYRLVEEELDWLELSARPRSAG